MREAEEFLYREAELADDHRFDEWLALWTKDALYWVPCNEEDVDPKRQISVIYDDWKKIDERVYRLKGGTPTRRRRARGCAVLSPTSAWSTSIASAAAP